MSVAVLEFLTDMQTPSHELLKRLDLMDSLFEKDLVTPLEKSGASADLLRQARFYRATIANALQDAKAMVALVRRLEQEAL